MMDDMFPYYILNDDNTVSKCKSLEEYVQFATNKRRFLFNNYTYDKSYRVSTVFLCIDHSFDEGEPVLFETMVFDGNGNDLDCERYCTYDEALEGHKSMCSKYSIYYTNTSKEETIENFEDITNE